MSSWGLCVLAAPWRALAGSVRRVYPRCPLIATLLGLAAFPPHRLILFYSYECDSDAAF